MGVDKHKKDSQSRANNLLSSSTFQEFSTQNNYRPKSQCKFMVLRYCALICYLVLSRNDYNTNTPSNPHNRVRRSCLSGNNSFSHIRLLIHICMKESGTNPAKLLSKTMRILMKTATCLDCVEPKCKIDQNSIRSNKSKTKLDKWENLLNVKSLITDRCMIKLKIHSKKLKKKAFNAQNRKKYEHICYNLIRRTNQLLNYFFQKSMKHNKQLCETFSDIDSIFPMKMTSFSREKSIPSLLFIVVLSRNTKMKHCTPKTSKEAKIFKKASLSNSRATVLRKSRVQYKHFKNANLPRVDARRMTFYKYDFHIH
ncbi:unnamed protein product [Moneuplotes crassus]|uniref:Uncharacterized protein n=1 Tax=Euplotes crassus TaxID=5936 RepID=A0AAD1U7H1_EUPCR|nr:unnamed protein product [Moneuplotes crassus]